MRFCLSEFPSLCIPGVWTVLSRAAERTNMEDYLEFEIDNANILQLQLILQFYLQSWLHLHQ